MVTRYWLLWEHSSLMVRTNTRHDNPMYRCILCPCIPYPIFYVYSALVLDRSSLRSAYIIGLHRALDTCKVMIHWPVNDLNMYSFPNGRQVVLNSRLLGLWETTQGCSLQVPDSIGTMNHDALFTSYNMKRFSRLSSIFHCPDAVPIEESNDRGRLSAYFVKHP